MKYIYICLSIAFLCIQANAQGIEIYSSDDDAVDVSGTTIEELSNSETSHKSFIVKNVSGASLNLKIERKKITSLEGSGDYLCWGADLGTATCYPEGTVAPYDPWVTFTGSNLDHDSTGYLASYFVSHDVEGSVQYRYYIIDEDDVRLDSVDVQYTFAVGIEEEQNLTVSVYPNPATSIVNIEFVENANNVAFNLFNVLGDKVMVRKLNAGNNAINVEALPNGVYFYSILQDGVITETKKLVVRH